MIIGNMKFEIEKHRKYTPEELADIILKEPYGGLFSGILLHNNTHEWYSMQIPCTFEDCDGKIFLHYMFDSEDDPNDREMIERMVSEAPISDATEEFKRVLKKLQQL